MNIDMESNENTVVLRIGGEAVIDTAGELKEALLKSLARADDILIDIEKVTAADLSFLQLLCSAHKSCLKSDKKMRLGGIRPSVYHRIVKNAGYSRRRGCGLDTGQTCLWVKV